MQSKKEMTNEINKQKEIIVQKFENAMKNKRNKSIDSKKSNAFALINHIVYYIAIIISMC